MLIEIQFGRTSVKHSNVTLFQDATFFDSPKNTVGSLTSKLSSDATLVQGVSQTTSIFEQFLCFKAKFKYYK